MTVLRMLLLLLLVPAWCATGCAHRAPRSQPLAPEHALAIGADVYEVVVYLNQQESLGAVDRYRHLEGEREVFIAWKHAPDGLTYTYLFDIKDYRLVSMRTVVAPKRHPEGAGK